MLWTDESKYNRFGSDEKKYVQRPINQRFNPRYTINGETREVLWYGAQCHCMV